jgi:hypothetical protein
MADFSPRCASVTCAVVRDMRGAHGHRGHGCRGGAVGGTFSATQLRQGARRKHEESRGTLSDMVQRAATHRGSSTMVGVMETGRR